MDLGSLNVIGALTALCFYVASIFVFAARLSNKPITEHRIGAAQFILAAPLCLLLFYAPAVNRPLLYYVQTALLLAWLIVELILDYILKSGFRKKRWAIVCYVVLFFAAGGGMIGVAANAGLIWTIVSAVLFLVSGALAFIQRFKTGK